MKFNKECKNCNKPFTSHYISSLYCCDRCKYRDNGYRERLDKLLSSTFDDEVWVDIKGYEGTYMVSTRGRIKSVDRQILRKGKLINLKGTIRKPNIYQNGYLWVMLIKENTRLQFFVHRIVATHLVDNPLNLPFVNHIDWDKTNNDTLNLEWCTPKQNVHHALKNGLFEYMQGENYHSATLTNKQVIEIRNGYNKGDNMEMIAKKYNVLGDTIRSVIKRKTFKNI
jgi:hypothetical protein